MLHIQLPNWKYQMKKIIQTIAVIMLFCAMGTLSIYTTNASSVKKHEDIHDYPLPLSVEALIPRHAEIIWDSVIYRGPENEEKIAVLYSTPMLGHNDSLKYLELFMVDEKGSATPQDRIYLGGRGLYAVDKVTPSDQSITIHAREHQDDDPMCNPTRHIDIIIKHGRGVITISKQYP